MSSSPDQDTFLRTPRLETATLPSSPLQPISPNASLQTHGSDKMDALKASEKSDLSPADCRTLQKILHDVRSSSPVSPAPYFDERAGAKDISDTHTQVANEGNHYEERFDSFPLRDGESFAFGDERDEGYKDEDDSMELSDVDEMQHEDDEGDTIEDLMNLPGKTASSVPVQDFSAYYVHDQPTSDEPRETRAYREEIEKRLEKEREMQERKEAAEVPGEGLDGAGDGAFQALREEMGMSAVEDENTIKGAMESFESYESVQSPVTPFSTRFRRVSEGGPLPTTSFIAFTPPRSVVQTPSGKHLDFALPARSGTINPSTPVDFFAEAKKHKGKENSPSKRRRNASSPEEIAELAREAKIEEEEAAEEADLKELDQYREIDLAPEEPVMESASAGDLITFSTPARARDMGELFLQASSTTNRPSNVFLTHHTQASLPRRDSSSEHTDSEREDWIHIKSPRNLPSSQTCLPLSIEQDEAHDADVEESDDSYTTTTSSERKQLIVAPQNPAFLNVIEMLPETLFWASTAAVFTYGTMVFDALVEGLTGLRV